MKQYLPDLTGMSQRPETSRQYLYFMIEPIVTVQNLSFSNAVTLNYSSLKSKVARLSTLKRILAV